MFRKKKEKRYITIYERDIKYGTYRLDIQDASKELMQRFDFTTQLEFCQTLHELEQNYSVEIKEFVDLNPFNYTEESKDNKDILSDRKYTLEDCLKEMEDIIKPVEDSIFSIEREINAIEDRLKIYCGDSYYQSLIDCYDMDSCRMRVEDKADGKYCSLMKYLEKRISKKRQIDRLEESIKWVSGFYKQVKNSIRRSNLTPEELFIEDKDLQGLVDHFMLLSTAEDQLEKTKRFEYWLAKYKEVNNGKE